MDVPLSTLNPTHTLTITHRSENFAITETDADGNIVERSPWMPAPICHSVLLNYLDDETATWVLEDVMAQRTIHLAGPQAPELTFAAARAASNPPGAMAGAAREVFFGAAGIVAGLASTSVLIWIIVSLAG